VGGDDEQLVEIARGCGQPGLRVAADLRVELRAGSTARIRELLQLERWLTRGARYVDRSGQKLRIGPGRPGL
jgi:hypothetical protein